MRRLATTVLTVVGTDAEACVRSFTDAANVSVIDPGPEGDRDVLARAQAAWSHTVRSHARYTMHDADPLAAVGAAWAAEFDGAERGKLDVAVADVLARWRAHSVGLPDYYLVLDPDALSPAEKHWYLGVVHRAASHRVVPVEPESMAVRAAIGRLRAGRWWPDLPAMLDGLSHELPDRVMVGEEAPTDDRP